MNIEYVYSFLVHPSKKEKVQPEIGGAELDLNGKLFLMLNDIFEKATRDCNIDIAFMSSSDGSQHNERRENIITLLRQPSLGNARVLAQHLQAVTTNRSGLGLLFIVIGKNDSGGRIYIARFPADIGIVAEETQSDLYVELLDRVFMKNAVAYKAVVFDGDNYDSDFWKGKAIDKQITNNAVAISGYWIRDFLRADFTTTSAIGTRRLAIALKQTIDKTHDLEIKEELSAAARLAKSLNGQPISMENFAERFGLSERTQAALFSTLQHPNLRFDRFVFSSKEFSKHVKLRSIQINNGAVLMAPVNKFNECFTQKPSEDKDGEIIFSTQGIVVDARLRNEK